jgi:hypothetical protein
MAEFNREWLGGVPEPGRPLGGNVYQAGLARLEQRGQGELAAVWYWANRLGASLSSLDETLQGIRFMTRIAAGFIEELNGAFGVILYTESPQTELTDGESGEPLHPAQGPVTINVDDWEFPVVIRESIVERHWCTAPEVTAPSIARAACWVRSPSRGYEGWLMPRHAVVPLNAMVSFSDGGSGRLLDHFGECIDSVVVSSTLPPARAPTRACWPVVAGQPLLVTDRPMSHQPVTVIDADLNLGVLRSAVFPIRFSTDWLGKPGNSGALIVEPSQGEPAGSYLGVLHPSVVGYAPPKISTAPSSTGYAQSCHQLEAAAGLEFML